MKKFNTQEPLSRRFRVLCMLGVMAVLTACSGIKLAYNQGDTLLYWWLDAYVDLDSEQAPEVKQDIKELFKWHRQTQLKDYVHILTTAQRQLAGNLSKADLDADYREIMSRTELLAQKALPELTDLALSIKPEQLAHIEKKFEKNNETFRKKFVRGSVEDLQEKRFKKSMEQFDLWFGGFSKEQEVLLRKASDARPLNNQLWLDERIRRQQKIMTVLRKIDKDNLGKEAAAPLVQGLVKDMLARTQSPENKQFFDTYTDGTMQMILTAAKIATPEQKAHAQKRMQGWISDFNILAADTK
ncbi:MULTISPECIES: DUF6279 family lipoprotein [Massilia]|uniref:Lipoprotein n=2 Tax=Massilia TaxID=149698 RepID=A0ABY4ABN3_9BURK|nr:MULTISPECIES: DUF6279 family lipoprotein [Massilia]NHZ42300.1 hypothetical protein [Massilia aquatica]UOD32177.1 hypothetical protein INH39_11195 [Massilia violaceinigra]